MSLLGMPDELLLVIGASLDKDRDIYALARTSHRLFNVTIAHLYRHNQNASGNNAIRWAVLRRRKDTLRRAISAGLDARNPSVFTVAMCGREDMLDQLLALKGADINETALSDDFTLLGYAAYHRHVVAARMLIQRSANVNGRIRQGMTPLQAACSQGYMDMAQLLLDNGADVSTTDFDGSTPLHVASQAGYSRIVKLLLDNGADPTATDMEGFNPVHDAARENHHVILKLLLDNGGPLEAECNDEGTALNMAAAFGGLEAVKVLLARGADVNSSTPDGLTPLKSAAGYGHRDVVELLLRHGANLRPEVHDGWPTLTVAAGEGHVDVCEFLLDNGADVEEADMDGWTPLGLAADANNVELARLLLARGANIAAAQLDGWTALHLAADAGHLRVSKVLIEHGADPMRPDSIGQTPLHIAVGRDCPPLVQFLLSFPDIDTSHEDHDGRTPLFHAAMRGDKSAVTFMLERNTTWCKDGFTFDGTPNLEGNKKDFFGTTPLCAAVRNGHWQTAYCLAGAAPSDIQVIDGFGRSLMWWVKKSGSAEAVDFLLEYARKTGLELADADMPLEENPLPFDADPDDCWCTVCTRATIHGTASHACEVCDEGDFLICGECYDLSVKCHDPTHRWVSYTCPGSIEGDEDEDDDADHDSDWYDV